jgi:DNA-binding NtrC family response regulator
MIGRSRKKVLVIDDDLSFGRMLTDYLRSKGWDVAVSDNPADAIEAFRTKRPRVVILDFNMPLATGDRFLPLLQEIEPHVKAVVVSGMTGEDVEDKFRGLGYYAFFEKGALSLEKLGQTLDEIYAA